MTSPRTQPAVVVLTDHRFVATPDGRVWTRTQSDHASWRPYADAWGGVRVVARMAPVPDVPPDHVRADGPGVTVAPVPSFRGLGGLARDLVPVLRAVDREVAPARGVLLRGPGVLALTALPTLLRRHRAYAVEVIGDSEESLRHGGVAGPLGRAIAPLAGRLQREVCARAHSASYVTDAALQSRYPVRRGRAYAVTDVDLPPEAFASGPRDAVDPAAALRLVLVGSLEQPYKGVDVAVRVVAALRGRRDCRLTVVGGGRRLPEYEALATRLGVADRVTFTGWLGRGGAVREVLDASDLFVMPSLTEGMPRALIEAMARALPAVGSDVGDIARLLGPGCVVPRADVAALAGLVAGLGPGRLQAMSARNLAAARAVAARDTVATRADFLRSVVGSAAVRARSVRAA